MRKGEISKLPGLSFHTSGICWDKQLGKKLAVSWKNPHGRAFEVEVSFRFGIWAAQTVPGMVTSAAVVCPQSPVMNAQSSPQCDRSGGETCDGL